MRPSPVCVSLAIFSTVAAWILLTAAPAHADHPICSDACPFANNGSCDDGGPDPFSPTSDTSDCVDNTLQPPPTLWLGDSGCGSDCTDCGPRIGATACLTEGQVDCEEQCDPCMDCLDNDGDGLIDCDDMNDGALGCYFTCYKGPPGGSPYNDDVDEDGFRACPLGVPDPANPPLWYDCDDSNPAVNLGATEVCGDTLDNDCDGAADCSDTECKALPECEGDDDDSGTGDDDSGDDDSTAGDDDSAEGDDDTAAGDDDTAAGDDDTAAGDDDDGCGCSQGGSFGGAALIVLAVPVLLRRRRKQD